MQLTANKPDVYASRVCRRVRILLMRRGLAAAVDAFASPLSHRYVARLGRLPCGFATHRLDVFTPLKSTLSGLPVYVAPPPAGSILVSR